VPVSLGDDGEKNIAVKVTAPDKETVKIYEMNISLDTTAPDAPAIQGIVSKTYITEKQFSLTGETGASIEYSIDGGTTWMNYSDPVKLTEDKTYNVTARQSDAAGNCSVLAPVIIAVRDRTYQVVSSYGHVMIVCADGTLWGAGINKYGQLGIGTADTDLHTVPAKVGTDNDWKMVVASRDNTAALKQDGSLWMWGRNSRGMLATGNIVDSYVPVKVVVDNEPNITWSDVSLGSVHCAAVTTDGRLFTWGSGTPGSLGFSGYGKLGNGTIGGYAVSPLQIGKDTDWISVECGFEYTLAMKKDGTLWRWGSIIYLVLTNETIESSEISPVLQNMEQAIKAIASGGDHVVLLTPDSKLYTYGAFYEGQRGIVHSVSTSKDTNIDFYVATLPVTDASEWMCVPKPGTIHSFAFKNDGSLWGWGGNYYGELGEDLPYGIQSIPVLLGTKDDWCAVFGGRV
jgi:alpha-tubulin suppressor-like RCC1 family protein